jgi:hypothetical protein
MADKPKPNKPLFSQHYLEHRLPECPEWQLEVREGFEAFNRLYQSNKDLLPTLNEAQTEEVFIKPALDILGFSHIPQVTTHVRGRAERPDYALFTDQADRDVAYPLQNDEPAFYARVKAIAEAKYWERPLSKVSANDQRDVYKNENPSFQISSYLIGTGVDWGILTNGREWRLYYRQASSTATEFYPVDLVDLLESGDLEQFKYFWLFFRQEALVKDPQGRNFLERVREGSTTYATRVGNELKALVFDRVFPGLAGGFVADATRRGETVTPEQVYEATLAFLYKLLFLLYAEARNLLPIDRDYREYSLIKMTQEVAQGMVQQKKLSQTSTGLYDRLLSLFQIIDRGDPGLAVPRYNGGLFHFDFSQPSDRAEYRANHFLSRFKVSDAVLAPVLDQLARFEGQPIDYSFLGVRQLGSIYEGLLEYRVVIEDGKTGKVYLENDKGERKATGSYYTPDYIVKYIISHTLKPILEQRQARFAELMGQIAQIHHQLKDKRLGTQSQQGLRKDLQRLEREAQSTLLDIKVCDPAMGSGHFLVEAVDYLTDELIRILNVYPERNPVLEMLEQTRQSILENLEQQGIVINPDRLEPTQLLQRVVMKRCIYGVDLNPMAVELAKVSLWLHSFTIGAPLSFLDHHLRCGNSLVGAMAQQAADAMSQEDSGQFNLFEGPFRGLLRAAEIMRGVSVLSDATFAEVEQSENLFREFAKAAQPYKRLLDIYISPHFGSKQAAHTLRVYGTELLKAIKGEKGIKLNKQDAAVLPEAERLFLSKRCFHWDLEFPEVFLDLAHADWKDNPGFDAVVGNPPYVRQEGLSEFKPFFQAVYESYSGVADLYTYFYEKGLKILCRGGYSSYIVTNKWLRAGYGEPLRKFFSINSKFVEIIDFGHAPIFADADTFPCIVVVQKPLTPNDIPVGAQCLTPLPDPSPPTDQTVRICPVPREVLTGIDLDGYVKSEGYDVPWSRFSESPWSLERPDIGALMEKIQRTGVSLKDFVDSSPLCGIKTGCNKAFLIDGSTRLKIIQDDPKSAEIISPYLRGQDIKRWNSDWQNLWIILLKSSSNESWSWSEIQTESEAEIEFRMAFPSIFKYMKNFEMDLRNRSDQGNFWWELRSCVYYDVFEKEKLFWQDLGFHPRFSFGEPMQISEMTCFALPTSDLWILGVLNSPLMWTWLWRNTIHGKDEVLRLKTIYTENLPIAPPTEEIREQTEPRVQRLIELTKANQEAYRDVLDWFKSRFSIEKAGQKLERFATLSEDEFLAELRKRIPKKGKSGDPLGVAGQKEMKQLYGDYGLPIQTRNREILQLEHQVSDLVNQAYGLTPEDIDLMWRTAPPRMPIQRNSPEIRD